MPDWTMPVALSTYDLSVEVLSDMIDDVCFGLDCVVFLMWLISLIVSKMDVCLSALLSRGNKEEGGVSEWLTQIVAQQTKETANHATDDVANLRHWECMGSRKA
jgi:hypothetical protein